MIQSGQTKMARVVKSGAGANGQALVVTAQEASRFLLMNLVTMSSPAKLQMKKSGGDLHLSLPDGDLDMPDVVIQDYFTVPGNQLQGISQAGEWMSYDTSLLQAKNAVSGNAPLVDTPVAAKSGAVALASPPPALLAQFDSPWGLAGLGAGAVVLGSSSGGQSGAGNTPSPENKTQTTVFDVFKNYAQANTSTKPTEPTKANYTAAGVTLATVDNVTEANVIKALNLVVNSKAASEVSSTTQLQSLADNLQTSFSLIRAKANGATAEDVSLSNPTSTDYANIGITVGTTAKKLDLMNSVLGELTPDAVDSVSKISDIAKAAENLLKVAAGTSGAAVTSSDLQALGLKINGTSSGFTSSQAKSFTDNLKNLYTGLGNSDALGTANVDTYSEVQALFSLQLMRSYNDDAANTKTQPAPSLADFTNIGIKSYKSLSDKTDASRVALDYKNFGLSSDAGLAATLNSALDNQAAGTGLTKAVVQSMVDSYYTVLKEAASTTTTDASHTGQYFNVTTYDPKAIDYTNLGITKSSDKAALADSTSLLHLLNDAVGRLSVTAMDTANEIQNIEKAAENILAIGAGTGDGTATTGLTYTSDNNNSDWVSSLSGFSLLGITGVNSNNVAGIKKAIDVADSANDGSAIDTVQELQAIVSLYRINDYADNDTYNPSPSIADYQAVVLGAGGKLTDVISSDNNYLTAYTDAVKTKTNGLSHDTFTDAAIKSLVSSYNTILSMADGNPNNNASATAPSLQDLLNVGLGNGWTAEKKLTVLGNSSNGSTVEDKTFEKANNLSLFADVIGGRSKDQVNSIDKLNNLATIVNKIIQLESLSATGVASYDSLSGGRLTISDFQSLGLDVTELNRYSGTVQTNRLYAVFDNIINANTDAISSLQALQGYINNTSGINS